MLRGFKKKVSKQTKKALDKGLIADTKNYVRVKLAIEEVERHWKSPAASSAIPQPLWERAPTFVELQDQKTCLYFPMDDKVFESKGPTIAYTQSLTDCVAIVVLKSNGLSAIHSKGGDLRDAQFQALFKNADEHSRVLVAVGKDAYKGDAFFYRLTFLAEKHTPKLMSIIPKEPTLITAGTFFVRYQPDAENFNGSFGELAT